MFEIDYIEWIGYLGSVIIAVSLTMTSMVRLRWLNLIGSIIFTVYGFVINAIPVAAVNLLIVGVNIVFIFKLYNKKDFFKILEIRNDSQYLHSFLAFYHDLIQKDFPQIKASSDDKRLAVLILRNMAVAGVFLARKQDSTTLEIEMDFVIPQYRDFKPGEFLLVHNQSFFKEKGIQQLWAHPVTNKYDRYYRKMGFQEENRKGGRLFVKKLN